MKIVNLIEQLPWHKTRRWSSRELSAINKIILHQELGEGTIENVNNYHINPNHISLKGCPHYCYHYGIRKNGEVVQANELSQIVWHTKGENANSIGIMFVGNFKGPGHELASAGPTNEQMDSCKLLVVELIKIFNLTPQDVFGHYHFGKPACPGFAIQNWIEEFRQEINDIEGIETIEKSVAEIQKRLNGLGYNAGPVDGIQGVKTLAAIRKFQSDYNLIVDGIVGPQTWRKLVQLTSN